MENKNKTYRAIRHDIVRKRQAENCNTAHHPDEKINQIESLIPEFIRDKEIKILELFAGQGNLTKIYAKYGSVTANEYKGKIFDILSRNTENLENVSINKTDSFVNFHLLISSKKKFEIIDLDPYGFPNRFFPDVFLLIDDGLMFLTMPKPYVNILNGITQAHLISYYGEHNPSKKTIIERIALWGICHWRKVELIDCVDCKSVWRMAFRVSKVKATEYTGVRNR